MKKKRNSRLEGELGAFVQQYARPSNPNIDPNDRRYDRKIEERVKRMDPVELNDLIHGDTEADAEHHAEAVVRNFVIKKRRARYLALLRGGDTGRTKLQNKLAHFRDLDPAFARLVTPAEHDAERLLEILRDLGAPPICYVISESSELDDRELPLQEALAKVVGSGLGSVISCIPGRLAYFESEEAGERYVLQRPAV